MKWVATVEAVLIADTFSSFVRQLSMVSIEDLDEVAQKMGIKAILPEWLWARMLFSAGIPD